MRDAFSQNPKSTMSKRVAEKCSNTNCHQSTGGSSKDPNSFINIGAAAHRRCGGPWITVMQCAESKFGEVFPGQTLDRNDAMF